MPESARVMTILDIEHSLHSSKFVYISILYTNNLVRGHGTSELAHIEEKR